MPNYYSEKYDWTSGNLDYKGANTNIDATEDETSWLIWKYTWDGSNNCIAVKGPKSGSWTNRASLGW